jgi:chaperonin GroEL
MTLESVTVTMLGRARKVVIDQATTTIFNGAGKKKTIEGRQRLSAARCVNPDIRVR